MCTVYLGYHLFTKADVAIKVVDSYCVDLNMLHCEREIMQALQHGQLVPCLDAGKYGRYHSLVMSYVQGGTLEDMLDGSLLTLEEVCILLEQLTSAVAYMHSLGLMHRDIKPANMLFDQDHHLYLTDFGIVTWLGERPGCDGHMMGTPHYVAPEILEGYVDERSEVYSVGILLYQMLTGYVPFDGTSDWKICLHHWETQPMAPSLLNPSLLRPLECVILRTLAKEPRHRYQTIEDVLHAFQEALEAPTFFEHRHSKQYARSQRSSGVDHRL
jgi:eukaryotic-like serine/threonine-protein kinase